MKVCATFDSAELTEAPDLFGLIGREIDGVSDRQPLLVVACRRAKLSAELRDVLVRLHDDAEHDGGASVEIDRLDLGGDVAAANGDEIGEPHQAVGGSDPRQHRLDRAHARKIAGGLEQQARSVCIDVAGRQHDVLALEVLDQRIDLNPDGRELSRVELEPDPFVLDAQQVDLGNSGQLIELLAEVVGDILDFPL